MPLISSAKTDQKPEFWDRLQSLNSEIETVLKDSHQWGQLHFLMQSRGQLMQLMVELIERKHLAPLTKEQIEYLKDSQSKLISAFESVQKRMSDQMKAAEKYQQRAYSENTSTKE